ncbi:hypothetical protein DEO72_LG8g1954 [Vigna unguiculata]|uniref:Uncharacterized protein n=1 Tax=Vigna unguiculata TaxID=3917 RepID=A0A4D6MT25_VIGUN|nr:hypothetical protein DEO72_LG8g1954 [Vigna unguiculata]
MSVSLRRRGLGLSDTYTRSGEIVSPKRDGAEVTRAERDFSSRRISGELEMGIWARDDLAYVRVSRLSEITWCGLCFKLAQAR